MRKWFCLAVAQVLLRYDDERHCCAPWPPASGTWSRGCYSKVSATSG